MPGQTSEPINSMGACVLLTPVIVAAWPAIAGAIASAAASLGYSAVRRLQDEESESIGRKNTPVNLEVPNSEIVTGQLGRDQKISITRDGVTITFQRDERGRASLSVTGEGKSHEELRTLGEEMSRRMVRDYVYQQIKNEALSRDFIIADESVDENNAIHITVRHWEN